MERAWNWALLVLKREDLCADMEGKDIFRCQSKAHFVCDGPFTSYLPQGSDVQGVTI